MAQMKFAIGSNYGQGSVHEDPTIENDDSEDNDSHNTNDSYFTDEGNFNNDFDDSEDDVYEHFGFENNLVEANDGFGPNHNSVVADVGVRHTFVEPDVVQQLDPTDPIKVMEMGRELNILGNNDDFTITTILR